MNRNFNVSTDQYEVFNVGGKYGIMTWDHKLVFDPKCIKRPNVESLEKYGYTFIQLEEGCNLIDTKGQSYLKNPVAEIMWFIQNKIVAFVGNDGINGLFFVTEGRYIYNIDDATLDKSFITTYLAEKKGLVTNSGHEVFTPLYAAVAKFDGHIYIAYTHDGGKFLNSPYWEGPTERAESFQILAEGIMAKFSANNFGWINRYTGKVLQTEELTRYQKFYIEFAKKKAELNT